MTFRVIFRKQFVAGLLSGLTYDDRATFSTWDDAQRYAAFLESHRVEPVTPCAGTAAYVLTGDVLIERLRTA